MTAGSNHLIAIEVWANGEKPVGVPGAAWLSFRPTPAKHQDLAGNWAVSINGHYVERFHHRLGNEFNLNVTPWVKFGQTNQVRLVATGPFTLSEVAVDYYDKRIFRNRSFRRRRIRTFCNTKQRQ